MALSPCWYKQLYTQQRPRLISRKAGVSLTTQGLQSAHMKIGSFQKNYCYLCLRSCCCFLLCGFSWETWSFKADVLGIQGSLQYLHCPSSHSFIAALKVNYTISILSVFYTHCPTSSTSYSLIIHDHLASISWSDPEFEYANDTSIGLQYWISGKIFLCIYIIILYFFYRFFF